MVAQRHAILRTNFLEGENGVVQKVHPKANVPIEVIDLEYLTIEKQIDEIDYITRDVASRVFDLEHDSLVRVTVLAASVGRRQEIETLCVCVCVYRIDYSTEKHVHESVP